MTISETLGAFVAHTGAKALGPDAVAAAKAAIADCVGCAVAGAPTEATTIVRGVAERSSAGGAATVIGGARALDPQAAALINGTAAHALDYDDILWTFYGHPSVAILPAALAVAETVGASGRDLVLAYALGVEVGGKLGRFVNPQLYEHGWHATAAIGVIGAAAAAAKLLHLDERRCAMALGIAASQACGVRQNFGSMTKPFHAGNAARGGVLAAELARDGFTSDLRALEGEFGWFHTLNARSVPTPDELQGLLAHPWELVAPGIVLKRYPACGGTHCALDALLALRLEHGLDAAEIETVHCVAHPLARKVLQHSRPRTGLEGKFSMEYCLAVAAIDGTARRRHFEQAWVEDPRVAQLLPRIAFEVSDELAPGASADAVPADVTIRARGTAFRRRVMVPSGDPRKPMTDAERREKFLDCTEGLVPAVAATRVWSDLSALETLPAVSPALAPLRAQDARTGARTPAAIGG